MKEKVGVRIGPYQRARAGGSGQDTGCRKWFQSCAGEAQECQACDGYAR